MDNKEYYSTLMRDHPQRDDSYEPDSEYTQRRKPTITWKDAALILLVLVNMAWCTLFFKTSTNTHPTPSLPQETSLTGIHTAPKVTTEYQWWTIYSAEHDNQTASADAAWEAMQPAHGFVGVTPEWASAHNLLPSMEMPSDPSKRVYILEAYHMLHCLKIMRKTFYQVLAGEVPTFVLGHTQHCFDAVRQNIMCNADDTLLYTWGRARAGDGQQRQCRDWNVLREWATEHTACYLEHEDRPGGRFYRCDDGEDGLVVGEA